MSQPMRLRMQLPPSGAKTSLCDVLDQLLDTGVVVAGELTIKVADVELLYVAVELVAGSWESVHRAKLPCVTGAAGLPVRDDAKTCSREDR